MRLASTLFPIGRGLLFAPGFDAGFVVGSQNFRASQIFVGVNVLLFLGLLFASAFLARGFGYILGLRAALRSAEKQAGTNNDGEPAAKRLAERHPRMQVQFACAEEVSAFHLPTDYRGELPMSGILLEARVRANGNFLGKRY